MNLNNESDVSADSRDQRMRCEVANFIRSVLLGENVSAQAWAEAHPDLMPELATELRKAQVIGAAWQKAFARTKSAMSSCDDASGDRFESRQPSTLHVRCPHCHNPVDIACDAPLIDILCTICGSSFSLLCDTQATPTLKKIGHFELVEKLGTGSFGTVWKARDTELDRIVAVKIPRDGRFDSAEVEQSFFREARAAAQLKHPGIVSVHEVGRQDGTIYIVSDLVRGASLSEWLTAAQPTAVESADLCAQIADALHHAHEAGVIHRDLKPSNIMVDLDGAPHIMDFGLARRDVGEITVTIDGQMLGTPAYMSPEQARGEAHHADRRTDVYSLGVILFQLLTGELPFRGHARMLILQILRDEPPKLRTLKAGVPKDLQTICLKCLEKEPARRYNTAADLSAELRRHLRGEPILARPITRLGRAYRWCRRQPAIAALLASLLIALTAGLIGVSWYAVRSAEGRANLYHRMVRQVQAGRMEMQEGHVARAWRDLKIARDIKTPELDLDLLRQEAVASLGDFRGYNPLTIESQERSISVCAMHPSSRLLAIGHKDGHIQIYDPAGAAKKGQIAGDGHPVRALSFGAESLLFVDGSGQVLECLVSDIDGGHKPIARKTLFDVDDDYDAFNFASAGHYLVSYKKDTAAVWDVATRSEKVRVSAPPDRLLRAVQISPNGEWLAATTNTAIESPSDRLLLWNAATGELAGDAAIDRGQSYRNSLAFSHDSKLIAFGGEGMSLHNVPDLSRFSFYPSDAIKAVAFSPDDQFLSLVQIRGTVAMWSMAANTKTATLSHARAPNAPVGGEATEFSQDGRYLISLKSHSVRIWDLHAASERKISAGHRGGVPTLAFSPDNTYLASGSADASVRIWKAADGALAFPPVQFGGKVQSIAFSPTAQRLAAVEWPLQSSNETPASFYVLHGSDFSQMTRVTTRLVNRLYAVTFSPDGKFLAVSGNGFQLWRVENPATNDEIELTQVAYRPGTRSVFLRFSPDSSLLAWADNWRQIRIWDITASQELPFTSQMHIGWHGFVFIDGDLGFVSPDFSLEVWNVRRNERQFALGNRGEFSSPHIAATANSAYLAGAHQSDTVALWDVKARKRLFLFKPERSEVWSLAFNGEGTKLAIGLSDGGLAIWDLKIVNLALAELDLEWMNSRSAE